MSKFNIKKNNDGKFNIIYSEDVTIENINNRISLLKRNIEQYDKQIEILNQKKEIEQYELNQIIECVEKDRVNL